MDGLINKQVVFFGGKGGVGKTTCSSAFSLYLSRKGYKTLVLSTDPAHSLGDIFETELGNEAVKLAENLYGIEIDPEIESKKYIDRIKKQMKGGFSPLIINEIEKQLDAAYHSPGAAEAAIFDKFIEIIDVVGREYDRVVFDTAPTGHTMRLLSLPELMGGWLDGIIKRRKDVNELFNMVSKVEKSLEERAREDPIIDILFKRKISFEKARTFLVDHKRAGFVFVLNPQRLPVIETEKAIGFLERYGIPVEGVIVNRVLPERVDSDFLMKRKEVEEKFLKQIEEKFGDRVLCTIPLMEYDISGYQSIDRIAAFFDGSV